MIKHEIVCELVVGFSLQAAGENPAYIREQLLPYINEEIGGQILLIKDKDDD